MAVDGIADLEAVENVLRFTGAGAGDVKIAGIVLRDFRKSDETFREDVRAGDGNIENVASGERGALRGVLRIDLIGGRGDLDLLMNFFFVIQDERKIVEAGFERERAAADDKETGFANFELVLAGRKIAEGEAAGTIGLGTEDRARRVFEADLGGGDGDIVFVDDKAGARGGVRGAGLQRREDG